MKSQTQNKILDYANMKGQPTNVVVPIRFRAMLRYLSNKTRIRQSEFIREALRDLLIKYRKEFKGSDFEF